MNIKGRLLLTIFLAAAGTVAAVACGSSDGEPSVREASAAPAETQSLAVVLPPEPELGTGVLGGNPDFDVTSMEWQGYWYSRYNLGVLDMMSGLGITFMPDMEKVMAGVKMVAQNPSDPVMLPTNMALLRAAYASGDPSLTVDISTKERGDLSAMRLDPAGMDQTVTASSQAQDMIKEIEWVRNFFFTDHFGTPTDDFGAGERFKGLIFTMISSQHGDFALKEMLREDGLFYDTDGSLDRVGNWYMLLAFADKAELAGDPAIPTNDAAVSASFDSAAHELHLALRSQDPAGTQEISAAIQALVWHAAFTSSQENRDLAVQDILRYGDLLLNADTSTPTLKAVALRELIEVSRVATDSKYMARADELLDDLVRDFDFDNGYFGSQKTYTVDDIAYIVGGLNAARFHGSGEDAFLKGERMLVAFWEAAINMSGLVLSAPPGKAEGNAAPYEQDLIELSYRYPTTPPPPMAGGEFGLAPVFASEVTHGSEWTVTDGRFDAAGAMHLSNEAIWLHPDLGVNGFPEVPQ